jgi:CheY-like chemotaxis protein
MNPETEGRAENGTFSQIPLLEEKRDDLLRRRQTAEDLRKHNLAAIRAIEDAGTDPEGEAQAIEDRFARETAEIDDALAETEARIAELRLRRERESGRILVVDDEKNIRRTVSRALAPLEMPVQTAADGAQALKLLEEETFSLLLLDLKMPGIDGMTVLETVRRRWPKTAVVILTAHGNVDTAVEAMKNGAADFIRKPFTPEEIRVLAKRVLGGIHGTPQWNSTDIPEEWE